MNKMFWLLMGIFAFTILIWTVSAWTPVEVEDDQNVFMPGSQPEHAGTFDSSDTCSSCHGGYDPDIEPAYNWRGTMMAQAARDPLWLACLTVSEQDSIWAVGNPNAGDICIRCHSPTGWLEGRSSPVNTIALTGDDFWGVQCDFCHKMIDPFSANNQTDVPADTDSTAKNLAMETFKRDIEILSTQELFNGSFFLNDQTNLPAYYGSGKLPDYVEAGAGQFFVDPGAAMRGPYYDVTAATHGIQYSRFHSSKYFCQACHDVSNPVLASVLAGEDTPEKQAAPSYNHVERTSSEFMLSAYGQGGSETNIPDVDFANKCQDCHMRNAEGPGSGLPGSPYRDDLPVHDFTGGNQWMLKILASADKQYEGYDHYNYEILSGHKYDGASIDVDGIQSYGDEMIAGSERAMAQLETAATLSIVSEDDSSITLRVQNNGGHKLISGFPEGRRMFLNVKFFDFGDHMISEINPYTPLVTRKDGNGNELYISGGTLTKTDEKLVWECEMSSSITDEEKTFHFALADDRYKDNRIPPKGFDTDNMYDRLVQPRWKGEDARDYFTAAEYAGGYDEVVIKKPAGTTSWHAILNYQTTSKAYIEFLRDEINGEAETIPSTEYIIQTDPFFFNLKGWGDAIYDLWLHNGGSAPVIMEELGQDPVPICTIGTPMNLNAEGHNTSISLSWDAVTDADWYLVYRFQNGNYNLIGNTTSNSFEVTDLRPDHIYCYSITAYRICESGEVVNSDRSIYECTATLEIRYRIELGPILDGDDKPVKNAKVRVSFGGAPFIETTDDHGMAEVTLHVIPPAGNYTVEVSKDGFEYMDYDVIFNDKGQGSQGPIPTFNKESSDWENIDRNTIIIVIVLAVIISVFMLFIYLAPEDVAGETTTGEVEAAANTFECPACGAITLEDEKVCTECGEEFEKVVYKCQNCASEIGPDEKICVRCGEQFDLKGTDPHYSKIVK